MRKITVLTIAGLSLLAGLAGACSSASTPNSSTTTTVNTTNANRAASTTNNNGATTTAANIDGKSDETPAAVKAAFPNAQSFTTQHKDVPANAVAEIEKNTSGKIPAKDHHSYLAFSSAGGKRTQIGAATVVKAAGKDVVIIYENKNGSPAIKEVRSEGVPAPFLAQFAGKGHDDDLLFGADLKANGADEGLAKAIAEAVRIDQATMQSLYGSAHDH